MPGSQLVNRLQDLNNRVIGISEVAQLVNKASTEGPMLIVADLNSTSGDVIGAIGQLEKNPSTSHIPVIAFAEEIAPDLEKRAQAAGAKLVVTDTAILAHLPQFLEQALRLE